MGMIDIVHLLLLVRLHITYPMQSYDDVHTWPTLIYVKSPSFENLMVALVIFNHCSQFVEEFATYTQTVSISLFACNWLTPSNVCYSYLVFALLLNRLFIDN